MQCEVWVLGRLGETPRDFGPIDDVPPGRDVVGATVLIFEVVGMFPDVDSEERDGAC